MRISSLPLTAYSATHTRTVFHSPMSPPQPCIQLGRDRRLLWKLDWSLCLHIGHYPLHPPQPDLDYRYCMRAACPARSVVLIYRLLSEEFHNVIKIPTNPKYKYQSFSQDPVGGLSSLAHVKYKVPVFSIWNLDLLVATLNMKHAATINTE